MFSRKVSFAPGGTTTNPPVHFESLKRPIKAAGFAPRLRISTSTAAASSRFHAPSAGFSLTRALLWPGTNLTRKVPASPVSTRAPTSSCRAKGKRLSLASSASIALATHEAIRAAAIVLFISTTFFLFICVLSSSPSGRVPRIRLAMSCVSIIGGDLRRQSAMRHVAKLATPRGGSSVEALAGRGYAAVVNIWSTCAGKLFTGRK